MAEREESFSQRHETPIKTGSFRVSLTTAAIYRLRILSSAFVCLRPFAGFASGMTLEMTLDANLSEGHFPETLARELH